jgi:hypothetical protein
LAPDRRRTPVPVLVRPPPVEEMRAETVRSVAAVVELLTVKVRVVAPRARLPERVEPRGLPVAV